MQANQIKAIVTGGASGLGRAVAQRLIADGGHVVMLDIDATNGQTAATALGGSASYQCVDVTSEVHVAASLADARETMGGLNVAVNCAGIIGAGRVLGKQAAMPLATFTHTVMVNLIGSFNIAKTAAALMQQNEADAEGERGAIINTASIAAFEGQIGQAAYAASKAGVVGMTLPMARELARFGIRVNTIAPGVFWTPMIDGMPAQLQESLAASIPFPSRLGKPDEYASMVAFILRNPYLNGETIRLDGALRLPPK